MTARCRSIGPCDIRCDLEVRHGPEHLADVVYGAADAPGVLVWTADTFNLSTGGFHVEPPPPSKEAPQ